MLVMDVSLMENLWLREVIGEERWEGKEGGDVLYIRMVWRGTKVFALHYHLAKCPMI